MVQDDADEGDWLPAAAPPGSSSREPSGQAGTAAGADAVVFADSNFVDERDRGGSEQMEQSRAGLGEQRYSFLGRPRAQVRLSVQIQDAIHPLETYTDIDPACCTPAY